MRRLPAVEVDHKDRQWRVIWLVGALALLLASVYWTVGAVAGDATTTIAAGALALVGYVGAAGALAARYRLRGRLIVDLGIWAVAAMAGAWMLGAIIAAFLFGGPVGPGD